MSVAIPVIDYINGETRRVYLLEGVDTFHWIEDIYREYIDRRANDEPLQKWFPLMKASGNNPKGGGKFTPRFVTLIDGCRVIPFDENILITATGEAITDNADVDPDPFDTSTRTLPLKIYITPPAAELVKAVDELQAIERMAFDNKVCVDTVGGYTGADKYLGTAGMPCLVIDDALVIARNLNIGTIFSLSDVVVDSGLDYGGLTLLGASKTKTVMTIDPAADTNNCEFYDTTITGTLDGETEVKNCKFGIVNYISGYIEQCELTASTVTLGGNKEAHFLDCWTGIEPGIIDLGGSGQALVMKNFNGEILLRNKTGPERMYLNLDEGEVRIDLTTVTAGELHVDGDGALLDDATGDILDSGVYDGLIVMNHMSSPEKKRLQRPCWPKSLRLVIHCKIY